MATPYGHIFDFLFKSGCIQDKSYNDGKQFTEQH